MKSYKQFNFLAVNNLMGHRYSYFAKYLKSVVDGFGSIVFYINNKAMATLVKAISNPPVAL